MLLLWSLVMREHAVTYTFTYLVLHRLAYQLVSLHYQSIFEYAGELLENDGCKCLFIWPAEERFLTVVFRITVLPCLL